MAVVITTVLHKGFHVPFVALWRYLNDSLFFFFKILLLGQSNLLHATNRVLVCIALLGASVNSQAKVALDFGVESGMNFSDNIALQSKGNESADMVVQVKPTVKLVSTSRKSTVKLDYGLQNLSYARNTDSNSIFHQLSATGQATFVPEMFSLNTDISRTQFSSFPEGRSGFSNFSFSDRYNVTRASVSPDLKLHYQDYAQGQVNYLVGHVSLDNVASSSNLTKLNARFNSGKAFSRFRWETKLNKVTEKRPDSGLQDINYQEASASAEYALFRRFYFKSEFGSFQSDYLNSQFASSYGNYTSYGLRYQPSQQVDIAAVGGPDYRSANFDLSPTPRTRLNGFWRDSKFGLGFGAKAAASFSLKLRHVQWRVNYSDSVTSIQQIILTQSMPSANLQTFQVSDYLFRQKQTSLSATRRGKKIEASIKFFIDKRDFEVSQGVRPASVAGADTSLIWNMDGRLNAVVSTHNEYRKTEKDIDAGHLESFSLGVELKKRRFVSASLSYIYTAQDNPLLSYSGYVENSIMVLATYQR